MIKQFVNTHTELERERDNALNNGLSVIIAKRGAVNSIYIPELQTKIIDKSQCQMAYNPIYEYDELMLPAECARNWLKFLYPPYAIPKNYNGISQSVPNWYSGQFIKRELVYFDLIGAYYQLYKNLWLDFCEPGMIYHYPLSEIADKLADWKAARNSLVGTLASSQICRMFGSEFDYLPSRGKSHYNPMILYFLNSLLTELANIALDLGACYIATDCHIFEYKRDWKKFIDVLNSYKLKYRCISGIGTIYKFKAYHISGACIAGDKTAIGTNTYKLISQYVDNPIYANDPRITKLFIQWNFPLKHVDRKRSYNCLEFYKRIVM